MKNHFYTPFSIHHRASVALRALMYDLEPYVTYFLMGYMLGYIIHILWKDKMDRFLAEN